MAKYTVEQVRAAASKACFYVDSSGDYFRIQWLEEDNFCAADENSEEDYKIMFEELVEDDGPWHFKELATVVI